MKKAEKGNINDIGLNAIGHIKSLSLCMEK